MFPRPHFFEWILPFWPLQYLKAASLKFILRMLLKICHVLLIILYIYYQNSLLKGETAFLRRNMDFFDSPCSNIISLESCSWCVRESVLLENMLQTLDKDFFKKHVLLLKSSTFSRGPAASFKRTPLSLSFFCEANIGWQLQFWKDLLHLSNTYWTVCKQNMGV